MNKLIGMEAEKKVLSLAVKCNLPALLMGDTGAGKTYLVRALAEETNKKLIRINLNGETGISELVGKWLLRDGTTHWQDGILLDAIRHGHWVVLDEINAALPEVLFTLNSLLDDSRSMIVCEKNNEIVNLHQDTRIFATCNPADDYSGVKELNKALLSRFGVVVHVNYPEADAEMEILKYHAPEIDKEEAKTLVDVANILREARDKEEISYICSTRDIVQCSLIFCADGMSLQESIIYSIVGKAPKEDRQNIVNIIEKNLAIKLPKNCKRGDIQKLLSDYCKTIDELEKDRKVLKNRAQALEDELRAVIDKAKKSN